MRAVTFPHLNKLAKDIWQFCDYRNLYVYASYISSRDNTVADVKSRRLHSETEWELSDSALKLLTSHFGTPEIDIFCNQTYRQMFKIYIMA